MVYDPKEWQKRQDCIAGAPALQFNRFILKTPSNCKR